MIGLRVSQQTNRPFRNHEQILDSAFRWCLEHANMHTYDKNEN